MKKGITLIELMVVIIVLGILTAIAIPNIKNIKTKATFSSAFENKANVQKGVDRYFLEKQTFPTQAQPTAGNPVLVDWTKLEPPYLIQRPQDINKFYYWVDSFGTVWMSDIDSPTNPSMTGTGTVTVSFDENPNAAEYQVGYIDATAFRDTKNLNANKSYTWTKKGIGGDGNFTASGSKVQTTLPESELNGKVLVVSAISKNGLQTAPVTVGYRGTDLPTSLTQNSALKNQKPVAVITMSPNSGIEVTTNIVWNYSSSTDPDGDNIADYEWQLDSNPVTKSPNGTIAATGSHTMKLRVQDSKGLWSDWASKNFSVIRNDLGMLSVGQYVQYGSYNGVPMKWRVIKKNTNDVMLFAESALPNGSNYVMKPFDIAPNPGEPTDANRTTYGSNNWEYSDIRSWLNTTFYTTAFSDNSYIKDTTHDFALSNTDSSQATSGSVPLTYTEDFNTSVRNYDTAYKKTVTDKVYLASIKELRDVIYPVIGSAVISNLYSYWLRDASGYDSYNARFMSNAGYTYASPANTATVSIRPALNLSSAIITSGSGTSASPYVIQ